MPSTVLVCMFCLKVILNRLATLQILLAIMSGALGLVGYHFGKFEHLDLFHEVAFAKELRGILKVVNPHQHHRK